MASSPYDVVRQFENELCSYTGAPYAVAVTSCTMALTLAVAWHLKDRQGWYVCVEIPRRTYIGVPYAIRMAGGQPIFRDENWLGMYQLWPFPVWDSARHFTSDMYSRRYSGSQQCVSFHWSKTLAIGQGGAILHDDPEADEWFRRARFDGRKEGVAPKDDTFPLVRAFHCYMSPRDAAEGLSRLAVLPKHNEPLPNDDYPNLSQLEIFK